MLSGVFTKSIDDRWRTTTLGSAAVGLFLVLGLAAYREIDLSVYTDLPESIRSVMNIPDGADVASLGFGVIYNLMAAMTLAGLAISIGASSFAGEERDGTIGLLLATPRSRTQVLAAKTAAMLIVLTGGAAILLAAGYAAPALLGVEMGSTSVWALVVHLFANALFFGFAAVAIGAWTGNRALASGVTAGVMVVSYVAVGMLPLVDSLADAVRVFPWYYFDGSQPLSNGISASHVVVQLGGAAIFAGAAFVGVTRRDLRRPGGGVVTLLDRAREHRLTAALTDRLAGSARVSSVATKAASENQALLVIVSVVMFAVMGVLMGPMYTAIEDSLAEMSESLPENLLAFVGGADMSTPEGWYQAQSFGLMAPIAVAAVTVLLGARALAGEEQRRTMGLLLANPISRTRIVIEKSAAMAVHAVVVGVAIFAGVALGSVVAGLGMSIANIAAVSAMVTALGLMFGALALAIGAATGSTRHATFGAAGVAAVAYLANSLLTVADSLDGWAVLSPFHWYLGPEPLVNGIHWGYLTLVVGITVALVAAASSLFNRRDLVRS